MNKIELYVDGACRGNPGIGGWGAYLCQEQYAPQEFYGGDIYTTNNRMELTAAIEGLKHCPSHAIIEIWTDSRYVQRGITEWIHQWKAKAWKGVKNVDLWQQLDAVCQQRTIHWHWIKGHAGHEGNEHADRLANLGADQADQNAKKKPESRSNDWLLNDPLGLDQTEQESNHQLDSTSQAEPASLAQSDIVALEPTAMQHSAIDDSNEYEASINHTPNRSHHPDIIITAASSPQQGPRQLILDTETTGFYYNNGDRIIEVGALELINRRLTGSSIHIYINPEKPVGESENIHGLSDDFLSTKPRFVDIAATLYDYLNGAEIIAHNASFDINFLDAEFKRLGFQPISSVCSVIDTLSLAKQKHLGQKNSLDALAKRYNVTQRDRTFHGALLDSEILADVYLAMTGGQVSLDIDPLTEQTTQQHTTVNLAWVDELPIIQANLAEKNAHQQWIEWYKTKHEQPCLWEVHITQDSAN